MRRPKNLSNFAESEYKTNTYEALYQISNEIELLSLAKENPYALNIDNHEAQANSLSSSLDKAVKDSPILGDLVTEIKSLMQDFKNIIAEGISGAILEDHIASRIDMNQQALGAAWAQMSGQPYPLMENGEKAPWLNENESPAKNATHFTNMGFNRVVNERGVAEDIIKSSDSKFKQNSHVMGEKLAGGMKEFVENSLEAGMER